MAWTDDPLRRRAYHVGNVRTELLDQARSLLEEGGLGRLSLRSLAARAGVAPGSVYHHFDSKAALLAELARAGFDKLKAELSKAAEAAGEGQRIRACALAFFGFARREPALYALMFDPEIIAAAGLGPARNGAFEVLEAVVANAASQQGRSPDIVHRVALAVWACGHGAASMTLADPGDDELMEDVIQGLGALFRRR